jgi:hypothetical protein
MTKGKPDSAPATKRQLSTLIDRGLSDILEQFQAATGLSVIRIINTALLHWFFGEMLNEEQGKPISPLLIWVQWYMALERGDLRAEDVPADVLAAYMEDVSRALALHERGNLRDPGGQHAARLKQLLKLATERKAAWDADIKEFGTRGAIDQLFRHAIPRGLNYDS